MNLRLSVLSGLVLLGTLPGAVFAQTGTVTGQVVDVASGSPMADVQISVQGTTLGMLSQPNGRFLIPSVPVGPQVIEARRIGYATQTQEVDVTAGGSVTVSFQLTTSALSMQGITVTGSVDPIEGVKTPFTVGRVSQENLVVPTTNSAVAALQGKVAGVNIVRGSGQPGSGVSVLLRTPTSIQRNNGPMYVVDGVILGTEFGGTTVDIESLDIASMEVVKGAAAASLYGSRAAGGVISITTNRGAGLNEGQTLISTRSEYGQSSLARRIPLTNRHHYLQSAPGQFINADGEPVPWSDRTAGPVAFLDNEYPETFDNLGTFFTPGRFLTAGASLAQNSQSNNFLAAFNRYDEAGALVTNEGFWRNSFRVNLDQRIGDRVSVGVSSSHSRSQQDGLSGSPFNDLIRYDPSVNLGIRGPDGNYLQQPDPSVTLENPIWRQTSRDNVDRRARTLASIDTRFTPFTWFRVGGQFSYDRSDLHDQVYVPKGTLTSLTAETVSDGSLFKRNDNTTTMNGSVDASLSQDLGSLNVRVTGRSLFEREKFERVDAEGEDFFVGGVPDLDIAATRSVGSQLREIRSQGFLGDLGLDYDSRYIASLLVRRDGSSLFGPDARWNTYYRAAASYRMAEEAWWPFEALTEFKLRAAVGTAGGRPEFADQYETFSVSGTTGAVSKGTLGNRNLRPEQTTEYDVGVDFIINDRYSVQFSYITQETVDQIIQAPLPAVTGYPSQWRNAGIQEGTTYELTLEAQLVNTPDFSWSATLVGDRSRSKILEFDRACFFSGLRSICEGAGLGEMWGEEHVRSFDQLPSFILERRNEFAINDEGYVVWVGEGNTFRDGIAKELWGTSTAIEGIPLQWGTPFIERDWDSGVSGSRQIGQSEPDFQIGFLNNLRWRGIDIHTHLHAQIGGNTYNNTRQRMYQWFRHADLDQAGKPDELKKPISYYQAIYNANNNTAAFVEDASYLKLRAVSVNYRLRQAELDALGLSRLGLSQASIGITGRNLFTWTNYTGYDPEVGSVLQRYDGTGVYPNLRNFAATVSLTF